MAEGIGTVYTRRWVVELVLDVAGYTVDRPILDKVLCEPSCGRGSFLAVIAERIAEAAIASGRTTFEDLAPRVIAYDIEKEAVDESTSRVTAVLSGAGIDPEVSSRVAESWIRQGDFLLSYIPPVDYVVGNPPYVRSVDLPREQRKAYADALWSVTMGSDLFVGFIQHGLDALTRDGDLTYICADRWLQNKYGKRLREYIVNNGYSIDVVARMHGIDAFEDEVDAYPSITRISRDGGPLLYVQCTQDFSEADVPELMDALRAHEAIDGNRFSSYLMPRRTDGSIVPLADAETVKLVSELATKFPSLEDTGVKVGIGLATGRDDVFIVDNPDVAEADRMLPAFSMRDHRRKTGKERWLVNPWTRRNELVSLEDYPKLRAYFSAHEDDLSKRAVARQSGVYYRTIDKPNWSILGHPMLLFPDMASKADPVLTDGSRYPCHNCYWMVSDEWDLKALGGLLMSDIATSFVDALGVKMRGGTLRFQAQYLRLIHVPEPSSVPDEVQRDLAEAFESGDREAASAAARKAYGL